jgi:CelD/BcsL family acetyltransferase involved in cellulose biosynthesis
MRLVSDLFEMRDPRPSAAASTPCTWAQAGGRAPAPARQHTIHGWLIAHNPEFERYSPGLMLFQDILKSMDGTPYKRLDLGAGDYRFKRELSNAQQTVVFGFLGTLSPADPGPPRRLWRAQMAEALPLGRMSDLPGKAMRRIDLLRGLH